MGIRGRLGAAWTAFRGLDRQTYYGGGGGSGPATVDAWMSRSGPSATRLIEAYKSIVYACANLNALGVQRVPLRLYAVSGGTAGMAPRRACGPRPVPITLRRHLRSQPHVARSLAGAERIDEVTAHPLLDALDGEQTELSRPELLYLTALYLDVVGNAYWRPNPPEGVPTEFWPLPAQDVMPDRPDRRAMPTHYGFGGERIPAAHLLRFRLVSPKDPYGDGYSPTRAAFQYAGLEDKFVSVQDQIMGSARPGLMLSPKNPALAPGEDERRRLEQDLNRRFSGPNAGRAIVTTGAYDVSPTTHPLDDLGDMGVSRYDLERIANCFGVPVSLLSSETNLANLQAAEQQHAKTIDARCSAVAAVLTRLARRLDSRLLFAFDPASEEDEERLSKVRDVKLKNSTLTVNEARAEDGYAPVPWGDEPWMAGTLRQPSEPRPQPVAMPTAGDKPDPGDDPEDEPPKPDDPKPDDEPDDDADADAERALRDGLTRTLQRLDEALTHAIAPDHAGSDDDRGGDGDPGDPPQATTTPPTTRGDREHLWAADGHAHQRGPAAVVPPATEGVAGDDPDAGGPDPGPLPSAG